LSLQLRAEIETGCRAEDPVSTARLDLLAARTRRARAVIIAQCTIWVGSLVLVLGAGMARGPVSAGAVIACLRTRHDHHRRHRLDPPPGPTGHRHS
jgi:hypothetical protein